MFNLIFSLTIFILMLGQLTSVSKSMGSNFYIFDIIVVIFVVFSFIYLLAIKKSFSLNIRSFYLAIFLTVTLISLLINSSRYLNEQYLTAFLYFMRLFFYIMVFPIMLNLLKNKLVSNNQILNVLVLSGVFLSIVGFIQLYLLPDFEVLNTGLGWDPHKNRLASTFFDPNFTGAYLVVCIGIIINKYFSYKKLSNYYWIYFAIILLALLLTFSRSSWLMFGVVIAVYGVFKSPKLLFTAILIAFLAYYAVPRVQTRISGITDPADSARFRYESWINSLEIVKDNWLTGVGYNGLRYVQKEYGFLSYDNLYIHSGAGSDSSLLFILETTGIFGLLFYLISIFPVLSNRKAPYSNYGILITSLIIALLIESQFINSMFYPQIMFVYLSILAIHDSPYSDNL